MDFLKDLALPQSTEHFHVLILIGALISAILYPYLGFLFGSSFLSYFFNRKAQDHFGFQLSMPRCQVRWRTKRDSAST